MKNPFRRAVKAPEFDESDLAGLRELQGVEHIPSPRHLPRFSVSSLSKQLIGLSEQDRRLFGQITRQDEVPANARKLRVRSISDGCYAPLRKAVFKVKDGDVPIEVARLENATVTPRGFVIHNDNLIWDAHAIGPNWQAGGESMYLVNELASNCLGGYDPFNHTIYYWGEPQETLDHGEYFLFNSGLATLNFAHAVHDTILQIPTFHECAIETPSLRPFMPGNAAGLATVEELLNFTLGKYAGERIFGLGRFCKLNSLLVSTPHLNDETQQISVAAMRRMRSLLDVSLSHHTALHSEDLFISRVQSSRGAFEATANNYSEFLSLLEKHSIKSVDASALAGGEYFEQFRRGRIFVGLHGAGLLNSMLAPNARLIELAAPGPPPWVKNRFGLMAVAAGMPFVQIAPRHVEGFQIDLDLTAIEEAIIRFRDPAP